MCHGVVKFVTDNAIVRRDSYDILRESCGGYMQCLHTSNVNGLIFVVFSTFFLKMEPAG